MEEIEKYVNSCFLELDKDCVFVYKIIKENDKYGLSCHEVEIRPNHVWVYNDFPDYDVLNFIKTFIPEFDEECPAKEISEGHYYELVNKINKLKEMQNVVDNAIVNFVKTYGLEQKI